MQRLESRELNDGITCFRRDQNPDLLSSSALHDVAISMGQKVERIDRDIDEYTAPAWSGCEESGDYWQSDHVGLDRSDSSKMQVCLLVASRDKIR
jgi:hypothetical protein